VVGLLVVGEEVLPEVKPEEPPPKVKKAGWKKVEERTFSLNLL
jgi:hypothetical protein